MSVPAQQEEGSGGRGELGLVQGKGLQRAGACIPRVRAARQGPGVWVRLGLRPPRDWAAGWSGHGDTSEWRLEAWTQGVEGESTQVSPRLRWWAPPGAAGFHSSFFPPPRHPHHKYCREQLGRK